ncbi:hypothetical protein BMS3Abin17_00629 [archaeon BMS3Abin17]|nr:hypothetical protein BMS3Abin17_00629 [archaeon BMS3Abin17]HDZ60178.1 hypothetical protein [Candidatus Pacearchaeota archaeon]
MLGNIIGGFIVILVGVTLAPTVANEVAGAQANTNITGASSTILGLTTLFYNLSIASTAIGIAAQGDTHLKPLQDESLAATAEYRLTSSRGQDRSVKHMNYARETDKANFTFHNGKKVKYTVRPLTIN